MYFGTMYFGRSQFDECLTLTLDERDGQGIIEGLWFYIPLISYVLNHRNLLR